MTVRHAKDFWSGVLFVLLGIFFIVFAQRHELGTASRMGPAYFPTLLGALMAIVGAIVALRGLVKAPETPEEGRVEKFHWGVLVLILGSVVIFSLLLSTFGLMISLAAMIVVSMFASRTVNWKETIGMIVLLDALAYVIFVLGVGMYVPVWPSFL